MVTRTSRRAGRRLDIIDAGGGEEFSAFAASRWPGLVRLAFGLTGDRWMAEDIAQTALARTYVAWRRVSRADDPDAYLRRILINACNRRFRRRRVTEQPGNPPETLVEGPADLVGERTALVAALHLLPSRQRAVIVLRYWAGPNRRADRRALGCSPGTVRSQLSRALSKLRDNPGLGEGDEVDRDPGQGNAAGGARTRSSPCRRHPFRWRRSSGGESAPPAAHRGSRRRLGLAAIIVVTSSRRRRPAADRYAAVLPPHRRTRRGVRPRHRGREPWRLAVQDIADPGYACVPAITVNGTDADPCTPDPVTGRRGWSRPVEGRFRVRPAPRRHQRRRRQREAGRARRSR